MARKRKVRRQSHGSAWHWTQTDCWYYTMPGTKKRIPLFGEDRERIRGKVSRSPLSLSFSCSTSQLVFRAFSFCSCASSLLSLFLQPHFISFFQLDASLEFNSLSSSPSFQTEHHQTNTDQDGRTRFRCGSSANAVRVWQIHQRLAAVP